MSELVALDINDIDTKNGFIKVVGKGDKERIVPMGKKPVWLWISILRQEKNSQKTVTWEPLYF